MLGEFLLIAEHLPGDALEGAMEEVLEFASVEVVEVSLEVEVGREGEVGSEVGVDITERSLEVEEMGEVRGLAREVVGGMGES